MPNVVKDYLFSLYCLGVDYNTSIKKVQIFGANLIEGSINTVVLVHYSFRTLVVEAMLLYGVVAAGFLPNLDTLYTHFTMIFLLGMFLAISINSVARELCASFGCSRGRLICAVIRRNGLWLQFWERLDKEASFDKTIPSVRFEYLNKELANIYSIFQILLISVSAASLIYFNKQHILKAVSP
jgi:hypothetical protein